MTNKDFKRGAELDDTVKETITAGLNQRALEVTDERDEYDIIYSEGKKVPDYVKGASIQKREAHRQGRRDKMATREFFCEENYNDGM